jgi:ABC-type transport system involved in cytochrome bd biosynthesis fused ATPase/permease subunit
MAYSYSSIDRDNRNWMKSDKSCGTLTAVSLTTGRLRGLGPFRLDLTYPISAIAGGNGSGKSTLLASRRAHSITALTVSS